MSGEPQADPPPDGTGGATPLRSVSDGIAEILALRRQGDATAAITAAKKLAAEFPRRPGPMNQLALSYLNADDVQAARTALQDAHDRGLPEQRRLQTLLQILWQEGDHQAFIETVNALLEAGGEIAAAQYRQLAICHRALGQTVEAERAVDAGLAKRKLPALATLKANLLFERDYESEVEAEIEALVTAPDMPPQVCHAIRLLHRHVAAYSDTAKRLTRLALERWPESETVAEIYREILPAEASTRSEALSANNPEAQFAALLQPENWPAEMSRARIAEFVEAIQTQIAPVALTRWLVTDIEGQEVIVSPRAPGEKVALVFTGLADRAAFPIAVLDAYLAAANLTAVYLRDHQRLLFCNGIATLGVDFASTVEALQSLTERLGARSIVTIGTSGGGLGALNYAIALGAQRSLCFSAPTNVSSTFLKQIEDRRGRAVVRRLDKYAPEELRDVRPRLLAASQRPSVNLVFGEDMPVDRAHAEHLRGIEGVTLHPLPGVSEHGSAPHSLLTGRLWEFIEMAAK